jgi:serine/threonine protein kinase
LLGHAAQLWSVGCIFAEMLTGRPAFPGESEIDQIFRIFHALGTPNETTAPYLCSLPEFQPTFPRWHGEPISELGGGRATESALDLLAVRLAARTPTSAFALRLRPAARARAVRPRTRRLTPLGRLCACPCAHVAQLLLLCDPKRRISARDALEHEFFTDVQTPLEDEPWPEPPTAGSSEWQSTLMRPISLEPLLAEPRPASAAGSRKRDDPWGTASRLADDSRLMPARAHSMVDIAAASEALPTGLTPPPMPRARSSLFLTPAEA